MRCADFQEALGAIVDGEDPGISPEFVERHVDECTECSAYREFTHRLRRVQIAEASPAVDLAPAVVKAHRVSNGLSRWTYARVVLAVCSLEVIVFSIRDLFAASGTEGHTLRHLGAFSIAFGAALVVVVVRPARARMMLPVAVVLALALLVTAIVDMVAGRVPLLTEARHIPELLSVLLLWLMAVPARRPTRENRLRLVGESNPSHLRDTA